MTKAYLSGPIIHDDLRRDDFYKVVVSAVEDAGVEIFAPQFMPRLSPREIYLRDVREVRMSDFLIAEVSNPSLGVGMEIMLSIEMVKPVLLFRHVDAPPLSYMVQGADGTVLFEYSSLDDVVDILSSINLDTLLVRACGNCTSMVAYIDDDARLRCVKCKHLLVVGD